MPDHESGIETGLLAERLRRAIRGQVLFDDFSRGRYSTDASIYQIMPIGVVVPRDTRDVATAMQIARAAGVPILARGGGTSQCGQTVARALVIDTSKWLTNIVRFNPEQRRVVVEPGVVLDDLNRFLKPHGLFFPVDVSTGSRATLGGMAGNNSCGARSLRYGNMVHNVTAIEGMLVDGATLRFAEVPADLTTLQPPRYRELIQGLRALHRREAAEIAARIPRLLRRVGGYNIDTISNDGHNMAQILVGSEGTLAYFKEIELALQPIPRHRVLGVCHFDTLYAAMQSTPSIVALDPEAVELVGRELIDLARAIPMFRHTIDRFLRGAPAALLLVEFAGDQHDTAATRLRRLAELLGDLGHPESVVPIVDRELQAAVWEVRKAGLNIVMSMKGDAKPVSFIEDCAVPLNDLAEYTRRLSEVFEKHGTHGTWYAHASVGCLHVRPILNMKTDGVKKMRAIAEEAFALVREYKGSHSGEHGDGLVRSEWHATMFGARINHAFEEIKDSFDPPGIMNPGKIVRPPRMDDPSLLRYPPGYTTEPIATALDWSEWNGFGGAIEMCNNNGACRKRDAGVMCPSYRATRDEQHSTRGRANSLRLALSGQLGRDSLTSPAMFETLGLCVGCKGCKRECPTGVDMARMKIEFLYHYYRQHRLPLRNRLVAYLPRYAQRSTLIRHLTDWRNNSPWVAKLSERLVGFSARRPLPRWSHTPYAPRSIQDAPDQNDIRAGDVVLLADTFNAHFEPEHLHAAHAVLRAAGYRVHHPSSPPGRPLCCGRSFLTNGLVDQARDEARRLRAALRPYVEHGATIIGLEPSCLLTLRDEFKVLLPGADSEALAARALLLAEFLAREHEQGKLALRLRPLPASKALLHAHCHEQAFSLMPALKRTLALIPQLEIEAAPAGCCGMAGAFGYESEHYDISMKMAELELLPRVRAAAPDTLLVADGISCRQQIRHGTQREVIPIARALELALA